jgi:hypothetical protein
MHRPDIIAIEAEAVGSQLAGELKSRHHNVQLVKPKLSKRDRQLEVVDMIRAGRVQIKDSIRDQFNPRKGGTEDSVDALVQGLAIARDVKATHVNPLSPVTPSGLLG